jgi:uncharacterized membrane-anchored protein
MKSTSAAIWFGALLALGILNFAIWQKEDTLANGETIYLKLAPVDPRSLMQGDYMRLNYALTRELSRQELSALSGRFIVAIDARGLGSFVRLDNGEPLADSERYLAYKNRYGAKFGIEQFFFQEGKGDEYAQAEYAKIRLSPNGNAMLLDLVKKLPPPPTAAETVPSQ